MSNVAIYTQKKKKPTLWMKLIFILMDKFINKILINTGSYRLPMLRVTVWCCLWSGGSNISCHNRFNNPNWKGVMTNYVCVCNCIICVCVISRNGDIHWLPRIYNLALFNYFCGTPWKKVLFIMSLSGYVQKFYENKFDRIKFCAARWMN